VELVWARKKEKPLKEPGVDEKANTKEHQYMTLVCDLLVGIIGYVREGRNTETLTTFYRTLSPE
jgi:transposase